MKKQVAFISLIVFLFALLCFMICFLVFSNTEEAEAKLTSIELESSPNKTHYVETESVDLTGLVLKGNYSDGSSKIETDFSCDKETVVFEDTKLIISKDGFSVEIPITVEKKIISISIIKMPNKTSYISGERLDLSGLEVSATYLDGTSAIIDYTTNEIFAAVNKSILISSNQNNTVGLELTVKYVEYGDYLLSYAYRQPMTRSASEEIIEYKVSKYVGEAAKIVIPKDFNGVPISEIDDFAFDGCDLIMITLEDNITYVNANSFKGCENTVICTDLSEKPSGWGSWDADAFPVVWAYSSIIVDDYYDYAIISNEAYIFNYKGMASAIVVPEKINGYPVVSISFGKNELLKNIILPETIEVIENYAFEECFTLASIAIPDGVTTIGEMAFYRCYKLSSVKLPSNLISIGKNAFNQCHNLTNIEFPSTLKHIEDSAFQGTNLTELILPSSLEIIGSYAFSSGNFEEIKIPEGVISIGEKAFSSCYSLKSISIPSSVVFIGDEISTNCPSFTEFNVSVNNAIYQSIDGNLYSKDGTIFYEYAYGKKETSFTIPDGVQIVEDHVFYNANVLTELKIPGSVTKFEDYSLNENISKIIIESKYIAEQWPGTAFSTSGYGYNYADYWKYCLDIEVVYESNDTEYFSSDSNFYYIIVNGDAELTRYTGHETNIVIPEIIDGKYRVTGFGKTFKENKSIVSVVIPDSITYISREAFYDCSALQSITIGSGVKRIDDDAFQRCPITEVKINDLASWLNIVFESSTDSSPMHKGANLYLNEELVTELVIPEGIKKINDHAFFGCKSLKTVIISNVTTIGSFAFGNCSEITSITLSNELKEIKNSAFSGCSNLVTLEIPNSVTTLGNNIIDSCSSLKSITVPISAKELSTNFFSGCSSLSEVHLSDDNLLFSTVEGNLYDAAGMTLIKYMNNSSYSTFVVPSGVVRIGEYAFQGAKHLKSIVLPDTLVYIEKYAFSDCESLSEIKLPSSIQKIGELAFKNCTQLVKIELNSLQDWLEIDLNDSVLTYSLPTQLYVNGQLVTKAVVPVGITEIKDYAFSYIKGITEVVLSDTVTNIGLRAFMQCQDLETIELTNSLVRIEHDAFSSCSKLSTIKIHSLSMWMKLEFSSSENNPLYYAENLELNGELLSNIVVPEDITVIKPFTFASYVNLLSVQIGKQVETIEASAFAYNLANITLDEENASYKIIDGSLYTADGKTLVLYGRDKTETTVTIPEGVTKIADYAFANCKITHIQLPQSLSEIGTHAFANTLLEYVEIPKNVDIVREAAFYRCYSLKTIVCKNYRTYWHKNWNSYCSAEIETKYGPEDFNAPPYSYILVDGKAILTYWNRNYTHVEIPSTICGYEVIGFGDIFAYDSYLKSVIIPENITEISEFAFRRCVALETVVIGSNVKTIGKGAFAECDSLVNLSISVDNVDYKIIGNGVYSADEKTLVSYIPGKTDTSFKVPLGVTSIYDYAFYNSMHLTDIEISNTVTYIGTYAFSDCYELINVKMTNSVTELGDNAFSYCKKLKSIDLSDNLKEIKKSTFYDCALETITIPSNISSIGANAFYRCNLQKINVNSLHSWMNISFEDEPYIYSATLYINGEALTALMIPEGVTEIKPYAFHGIRSITSLTLPNSLISIGEGAFSSSSELTSLTIPQKVTTIGAEAFYGCRNVTSLTFLGSPWIGDSAFSFGENFERINVKSLDQWLNIVFETAFANPLFNCYNQKPVNNDYDNNPTCSVHLYINGSVPTEFVFPEGYTEIKPYSFFSCHTLKSVIIPSGATVKIGEGAFANCFNLKELKIDGKIEELRGNCFDPVEIVEVDSLDTWLSIDFSQSPLLSNSLYINGNPVADLVIPDDVLEISNYAFANFSGLRSVVIPSGTTVREYAFYNCENLVSVLFSDGTHTIENAFSKCPKVHFFFEGKYYIDYDKWNKDNRPVYYNAVLYKSSTDFYCEIVGDEAKIVKYIGNDINVVIPDFITIGQNKYKVVEIANEAFSHVNNVSTILIGANIKKINNAAFRDSMNISAVYVAENNEHYKVVNGGLYSCSANELIYVFSYVSGVFNVLDGTEIIYAKAFIDADRVTEINIPESLQIIETLAFYNSDKIEAINVNVNNAKYKSNDGVLYNKDETAICYYPIAKKGLVYNVLESVVFIDSYCFMNNELKVINILNEDVDIRDSAVTYNQIIIRDKHYLDFTTECVELGSLVQIVEESGMVFALTSNDNAVLIFYFGNDKDIVIPAYITYGEKNYAVVMIKDRVFYENYKITSVKMPNTMVEIGQEAFESCLNLKNAELGSGLKVIGLEAFANCGLETITIPSGLTTIKGHAFYYNENLTKIVIPQSVSTIDVYAFYYCNKLTIYCEASSKPNSWDSCWNPSDCTVIWNHTDN